VFNWLGNEFCGSADPDCGTAHDLNGSTNFSVHSIAHTSIADVKVSDPALVAARRQSKLRTDQWFYEQAAYLLDKLAATPDGDGSLLDHSVVLFANTQSNGPAHKTHGLPWIVAGGGLRHITTGKYWEFGNWEIAEGNSPEGQFGLVNGVLRALATAVLGAPGVQLDRDAPEFRAFQT